MRILAGLFALLLAYAPAKAWVLIIVDIARQDMVVYENGEFRYLWLVSTGSKGFETPPGSYTAQWLDRDHYSKEYDNAPMPYSIFFDSRGYAIHGTDEVHRLGRQASHGCIRIRIEEAEILFKLVGSHGLSATTVIIQN